MPQLIIIVFSQFSVTLGRKVHSPRTLENPTDYLPFLFSATQVTATNGAAAATAGPEDAIEMTEKAPVTATASTATVQSGQPAKGSMMSKQARNIILVFPCNLVQ